MGLCTHSDILIYELSKSIKKINNIYHQKTFAINFHVFNVAHIYLKNSCLNIFNKINFLMYSNLKQQYLLQNTFFKIYIEILYVYFITSYKFIYFNAFDLYNK